MDIEQVYKKIERAEEILANIKHDAFFSPEYLEIFKEIRISRLKSLINDVGLLLKNTESKQPKIDPFVNTMLSEVPPGSILGATPAVKQNEQTKEVCPYCQCPAVGFGGKCGDGSLRCMEC